MGVCNRVMLVCGVVVKCRVLLKIRVDRLVKLYEQLTSIRSMCMSHNAIPIVPVLSAMVHVFNSY